MNITELLVRTVEIEKPGLVKAINLTLRSSNKCSPFKIRSQGAHTFPGEQSVPSAHGMCWVLQPRWAPSGLVHHSLRHCICKSHKCTELNHASAAGKEKRMWRLTKIC